MENKTRVRVIGSALKLSRGFMSKHERRIKYGLFFAFVVMLSLRLLTTSLLSDGSKTASEHYCSPFGVATMENFVFSNRGAVSGFVGNKAVEELLENNVHYYYIDVTRETQINLDGWTLPEAYLVRSSSADAVYKWGAPVADNSKPANVQTIEQFLDTVAASAPSANLLSRRAEPIVVINPRFDISDSTLSGLIEAVRSSPLAERIAIVSSTPWMSGRIGKISPKFVAFEIGEESAAHVGDLVDALSDEAVPIFIETVKKSMVESANFTFTSPHWLNGTSTLRQRFPRASILAKTVNTRDQMLWTMDHGVDGIISDNPVLLKTELADWYRTTCGAVASSVGHSFFGIGFGGKHLRV